MKQVILNLWQENATLSMINQMQTMMQEMDLSLLSVKSNLYDYNDAYILVKGDITVIPASATKVSF